MTKQLFIILTIFTSSCLSFNQEPMSNQEPVSAPTIPMPDNKQVIQSFIDNHPVIKKPNEEPVNTYYVSKDADIIKSKVNKLASLGSGLREYIDLLPEAGAGGEDVGFNLSLIRTVYYGGYGNFRINILHFKDRILCVNIDMQFTGRSLEFIRDEIIQHINFPITCSEYGISNSRTFEKEIEKYRDETGYPLRFQPENDNYSKKDIEDYNILTSPTSPLMWGRKCGYANRPPLGRKEMDNLVNSKKYKLVEEILYSSNVVGRIYALQALEEWDSKGEYQLTQKAKNFIQKVKDLDVKFEVCDSGCSIVFQSYKELISNRSTVNKK